MKNKVFQTGFSLAGLITFLLSFVIIAFSVGWLASKYYANRQSPVSGNSPDSPYATKVDAKPDGMTWNEQQLNELVDVGKIDYKDSSPVGKNSIKVEYFRGTIEDNDLTASWKILAGSEILSGLYAPVPQDIPDDYDFHTFIRYLVRITNLHSGDEHEYEYEYDYFGDVAVQEDEILLEEISPGEYKIEIETNAQYYTEKKANHYNAMFEFKLTY
ncbi:MAG: hypothetical protein ACN4GR_12055 [Arenicellales bacterium]